MFCVPQRKGYQMANDFRFLMYNSPEEDVSINAVVKDETIWLTQKAMAELFGVQTPAISKHLKNIFEDGEPINHQTIAVASLILALIPIANVGLSILCIMVTIHYKSKRR